MNLPYDDPPPHTPLLLTLNDDIAPVRAFRADYLRPRSGLAYRFLTSSTHEFISPLRVRSWTLAKSRAKQRKVR